MRSWEFLAPGGAPGLSEVSLTRVGRALTVDVRDLNEMGQGVGATPSGGPVVFVDGALPGERVVARVRHVRKRLLVASLEELLLPSEDRRTPECPVFGNCGGCTLLHMSYCGQLQWKRKMVQDALARIGGPLLGSCEVRDVLGMQQPFGYRCKVRLAAANADRAKHDRALRDIHGPELSPVGLGYYHRASHVVVPSASCQLEVPTLGLLREACGRLWRHLPRPRNGERGADEHAVFRVGWSTGQVMVCLQGVEPERIDVPLWWNALAEAMDQAGAAAVLPTGVRARLVSLWATGFSRPGAGRMLTFEHLAGEKHYEERLGAVRYLVSPGAFFQVNPSQATVLYEEVVKRVAMPEPATLLDLYCGAGAIGLYVASSLPGWRVLGVDEVSEAVRDARQNARQNAWQNAWQNARQNASARQSSTGCQFVTSDTEVWLRGYLAGAKGPHVAVVDPPRSGLSSTLVSLLVAAGRRRLLDKLIYVSCNPSTLSRDLKGLASVWKPGAVQPIDMFPWTSHVECVIALNLRSEERVPCA